MRKYIVVILNPLNIKKIKSTKIILKKFITKKNMWGMTVAIHNVFFLKSTKQNFQPPQYEKNKIEKDNFRKKVIKKGKKPTWGNTVVIHNVLKEKTTKLNSEPA
jgi:hypothetical protein